MPNSSPEFGDLISGIAAESGTHELIVNSCDGTIDGQIDYDLSLINRDSSRRAFMIEVQVRDQVGEFRMVTRTIHPDLASGEELSIKAWVPWLDYFDPDLACNFLVLRSPFES